MRETLLDFRRRINSGASAPVAPKELQFPVQNNFFERAVEGVYSLIVHAGLEPHHYVLDFGCGIGRLASPLTQYLSPKGGYEGLEVNAEAVKWCAENITPQYPTFRFKHIDVFNDWYNPDAATRAEDYKLPFPDKCFQTIVLSSVFTHLSVPETQNYLNEIGRVLDDGGRIWSSWYLINEEARTAIQAGNTQWRFNLSKKGPGFFANSQKLGQAASFDEEWVRQAFMNAGLEIEIIYLGFWAGREQQEQTSTGQDVIIAGRSII